jgi:proteasome lid subunit RPN8/RPN11
VVILTYNQEDKTLEIELGESREITVNTSGPRQLKRKAVFSHASSHQPIYMHLEVWNHLWKYSKDNQNREVGGVLVGKTVMDSGVSILEVTGFIEGRHMKEKFSSLTFTHETWNDINTRRKEEYPDKKIVGWFHTHPGHGIFLSRYDLFIHQNFFPGKDQIAVVFDPLRTRYGFFVWEADQVKESNNVFIFVYNNEKFDQEIQNLSYIGNIDQHTDSEVKPHIDVDVDVDGQEVTEEEHRDKKFEEYLIPLLEEPRCTPDLQAIVPILHTEPESGEQDTPQPVISDNNNQDLSSPVDLSLSSTRARVRIEYSGETNLSQNNSPSEFDAIREKRDQEYHEIIQDIDRPGTTRDKP